MSSCCECFSFLGDGGSKPSLIKAAGYGQSTESDPSVAVTNALKEAGITAPTMAIIACTVAHDTQKVGQAFAHHLPKNCGIHGVTSCGNILTTAGPAKAVGCLLFDAPGAFASAYGSSGKEAAMALKTKMGELQAIIMATTPGGEEGAIEEIGTVFPGVPVYGGTAADNEINGGWRLFSSAGAKEAGVSLVGVKADTQLRFGTSMLGPYTPTHKTAKVTDGSGRVAKTLDGKPASDWVYEWLGEPVKEAYEKGGLILGPTSQKPIGIKQPTSEYITSHLAELKTDKSVVFFTPVKTGDVLTVMDSGKGPATGYSTTLATAFDTAKKSGKISAPKAGILLYCGGMSIAVGEHLGMGLTSRGLTSKVKSMPMIGMTVFGEQTNMKCGNVQRNLSMGFLLFQ